MPTEAEVQATMAAYDIECEQHRAAVKFLSNFRVNGYLPFCSAGVDGAAATIEASDGLLALLEQAFQVAEDVRGAEDFLSIRPQFFSKAMEGLRQLQALALLFVTEPQK